MIYPRGDKIKGEVIWGELFEELNQNKSTYATVYIDALIPKSAYITGQGNLATEHLNFKAKKGCNQINGCSPF